MLFICGPCIAPFILIGAIAMVGTSEKNNVCQAKAIVQGEDAVLVEPGCDKITAANGELAMFTCDLQQEGMEPAKLSAKNVVFDMNHAGWCLSTTSQMYACKETE